MPDRINVGVLVSEFSSLFPFIKLANMRIDMKAWKIWEDRIENVYKNDVIIQDEELLTRGAVETINSFFRRGGTIIQMFSNEDEVEGEYIMKDGVITNPVFEKVFENVDLDNLAGGRDGLDIKLVEDEGFFVSFSKNIIAESLIEPGQGNAAEPGGDVMDGGGTPKENLELVFALIKHLWNKMKEKEEAAAREEEGHRSRTAILLHGRSLWLDASNVKISTIIRAVFSHLEIEDFFNQVYKEPEFRRVDPDLMDKFPDIYYYHQTFPDDEDGGEKRLANVYLNEARKVHANIRTAKSWEHSNLPTFFADVARFTTSPRDRYERLYIYPPSIVAGRKREVNRKILVKCMLEPARGNNIESFLIDLDSGTGKPRIIPAVQEGGGSRPWKPRSDRALVVLDGNELLERINVKEMDRVFRAVEKIEGEIVLKVIFYIGVDEDEVKFRIKEYSVQKKKVDEKVKARLNRLVEKLQGRLHASAHMESLTPLLEEKGFMVIEMEDSRQVDEDIRIFLVDQLLPLVRAKKLATIHHVLNKDLENDLRLLVAPLLSENSLVPLKLDDE